MSIASYRFDTHGTLVRDIRVQYAFHDLPLSSVTIHGKQYFIGAVSGVAEVGGDICEPFVVHDLHIVARCPATGQTHSVLMTPDDDLHAPVLAMLRDLRGASICSAIRNAEHDAAAATITSPPQRRLFRQMAASLPGGAS